MARKPMSLAKLDATTPKWPELRVQIAQDDATIYIAGIGHQLDSHDPQGDAVLQAGQIAAQQGTPIRLTATDLDKTVVRMIITTEGQVHILETARPVGLLAQEPEESAPHRTGNKLPATPPPPPSAPAKKKSKKKSRGPLAYVPPAMRGLVKWGGLGFVVLLAASIVVLIIDPKGRAAQDEAAPIVQHPAPPAGQLYTETAPPSWNATATWVLPIADDAQPAVDAATGTIAVFTPNDRTTGETEAATASLVEDRRLGWLSILEPDGTTRWTYALDRRPQFGPAIVDIDGTPSVVLGTNASSLTSWPLTGGQASTIDLPDGMTGRLNVAGDNVLATLTDERLAVLRAGRFDIIQALPRTEAVFAIGSTAISIQPETGTWWTQQAGADPIPTTPAQPAGTEALDSIIAITPAHVILAWTTPDEQGKDGADIIAAYNLTTGEMTDSIRPEIPVPSGTGEGFTNSAGTITAAAGIILADGTLTAVPQLRVETVQADQVHGTIQGDPVVITDGRTTATTAATLIPTAVSNDRILVISQRQLYAFPRASS